MNEFEIELDFDNEKYKANVKRIGDGPIQYHITKIIPHSTVFPECIIMTWNYSEEKLEWGVTGNYNPLFNYIIATAIFKKLEELNIPIY